MPTANKVKFGLSNVHYAVQHIADDGTISYDTPVAWPGARSISLDPQGEATPWYADDGIYYMSNVNNGYQGDLEMARVIDAFTEDVLGLFSDSNDMICEAVSEETVHFALMFEFAGDAKHTRHIFYDCISSRPSTASATIEDSTEPQTESVTITAMPLKLPDFDRHSFVRGVIRSDNEAYDDFFDDVVLPNPKVSYGPANPLTVTTGIALPATSLTVAFEPVQAGTGNPSPTNVRAITGWDSISVTRKDGNNQNSQTYTVSLTSAGTVYGGTLNVVIGKLTIEKVLIEVDSTHPIYNAASSSGGIYYATIRPAKAGKPTGTEYQLLSNRFIGKTPLEVGGCYVPSSGTFQIIAAIPDQTLTTKDAMQGWFDENPTQFVYKLATPEEVDLTPTQVDMLLGTNVLTSDGLITAEFWAI